MRPKRLVGLASAGIAAVASFALAQPAQAAYGDCPSGALCAWTGASGSGTRGAVYSDNADLSIYTAFAGAASVANNGTQCSVTIWTGRSGTGSFQSLPRGYGWNLAGTSFYHHVYSNYWC
jgi:hypothetical protein